MFEKLFEDEIYKLIQFKNFDPGYSFYQLLGDLCYHLMWDKKYQFRYFDLIVKEMDAHNILYLETVISMRRDEGYRKELFEYIKNSPHRGRIKFIIGFNNDLEEIKDTL